MGGKILDIHRLASDGETIRRIRCLPGRITVLRAARESEIEIYYRAICGDECGDRFTILVNDAPFRREDHILIGFGRPVFSSPDLTVAGFLSSHGAPVETLEPLLLKLGLGGSSNRRCCDLSEGEAEILQILGATYCPGKILLLHNPFENVNPRWRERLAELIVDYVSRSNGTVLVTRLPCRPECWIENEYIARMQLERPRKATIGFGGSSGEEQDIIKALRAEAERTESQETRIVEQPPSGVSTFSPVSVPAPAAERMHPVHHGRSSFDRLLIALVCFSIAFMAVVFTLERSEIVQATRTLNNLVREIPEQEELKPVSVSVPASVAAPAPPAVDAVPAPQKAPSKPILDGYPEAVQISVRLALLQPEKLLNPGGADADQEEDNSQKPSELEKMMRDMSDNEVMPENVAF